MRDWHEIARRVAAGEDIQAVLDEVDIQERADFDHYLRHELNRPDLADRHAAFLRDLDLGIYGARQTWAALTLRQRETLKLVAGWRHPRLVRPNTSPTHYFRDGTNKPPICQYPTVRNLCERELLAWDGGAFEPWRAAVLTERGRFVVRIAGGVG